MAAYRGKQFPSPRGRQAQFIKGEVPDWIDRAGVLVRATVMFIKVNGVSQVPGYQTVRPETWGAGRYRSDVVAARPGDFGLYLGKKHVRRRLPSGRDQVIPVPTFWFNGHRIVFTTLVSYDDAVVSDELYDSWRVSTMADRKEIG